MNLRRVPKGVITIGDGRGNLVLRGNHHPRGQQQVGRREGTPKKKDRAGSKKARKSRKKRS